jgi:hypothetical protein
MPARQVTLAGHTNLDKIIAEVHRVPASIKKIPVKLIGWVICETVAKVLQNVLPEKFTLFFVHVLAEQISCTDTFQFKVLDILHELINEFAESDDRFA